MIDLRCAKVNKKIRADKKGNEIMNKNKKEVKNMVKKMLIMGVALMICLGLFAGCTDYGYEFHFDVIDGNGELTLNYDGTRVWHCNEQPSHKLECTNTSRYVVLMGGKKGSHELTFLAIPNEGYQVKEWLFNGEVVEGHKFNSYTAKVSSEQNYYGIIAVTFEPIPNN